MSSYESNESNEQQKDFISPVSVNVRHVFDTCSIDEAQTGCGKEGNAHTIKRSENKSHARISVETCSARPWTYIIH